MELLKKQGRQCRQKRFRGFTELLKRRQAEGLKTGQVAKVKVVERIDGMD